MTKRIDPNFQNPLQPNGGMHPDDRRNMLLFVIMAVSAYFGYVQLFVKPHAEATKAAQQTAAQSGAPVAGDTLPQPLPKLSRADALVAAPRLTIDAPGVTGSIALKGLRFDDAQLKTYFEDLKRTAPVTMLSPARTDYPEFFEFGWVQGAGQIDMPTVDTVWKIVGDVQKLTPTTPVTVSWVNPQQVDFKVTFAIDEQYVLTVTQAIQNNSKATFTVLPYTSLVRHGLPDEASSSGVSQDGAVGYIDETVHQVTYANLNKEPNQNFSGGRGWLGFGEKYWFAGFAPKGEAARTWRLSAVDAGDHKNYQVDVTGAGQQVAAGASVTDTTSLYIGPKKLDILNAYEKSLGIPRFDLVIDFGWFWFLTIPFFHLLNFLGSVLGNFAVALLLFTVIVRLAVFPLANKSYRSFARMRKVAPQMKEIQERHKDNREAMQKAIFEMYQREKVNPMAGCLPILVQIPIFFALYKVLFITIEMRHQPFWGWIADMSAPDPTSVFNLFGLVPWQTPVFLTIGVWPILMAFTMFLQQQMSPPVPDPVQRRVFQFMPVMMLFMMAHFPAGLVIYWTWSNTLSVIQQYVLMKQEGVEPHLFQKINARRQAKGKGE